MADEGNNGESTPAWTAWFDRWLLAPFVATAWMLPIWAAVYTIGAELGSVLPGYQWLHDKVGYGCLLAVATWILVSILFATLTTPSRANSHSYLELQARIDELDAFLAKTPTSSYREACDLLAQLKQRLQKSGLRWVMATGYIDAWEMVHRVEEALITDPQFSSADVARVILRDQLRLEGAVGLSSSLNQVLICVAGAMRVLCSPITPQLIPAGPVPAGPASAAPVPAAPAPAAPAPAAPVPTAPVPTAPVPTAPVPTAPVPADEAQSRQLLRGVSFAINDFRDANWSGLVRLRNQTIAALVLTEVFAYEVLALSIAAGAQHAAILAGVVFYLVAATVGLLNQLYLLSQTDTAIEDYGLSNARLLLIPTLSGLAGLGGVFLTALVFSSGFSSLLQPETASAARATARLPQLVEIFNLTTNPAGLLFAVLFGFAPVLLLSSLQDLGSKYKKAIGSTEVSTTVGASSSNVSSQGQS
jgi:hypothetical protein